MNTHTRPHASRVVWVWVLLLAGTLFLLGCSGRSTQSAAAVAPAAIAGGNVAQEAPHVHVIATLVDEGDAALPVVRAPAVVAAIVAAPASSAARSPATAAPPPPPTAAPAAAAVAPSSAPPTRPASNAGVARVVDRGRSDRQFVALSFDAGADVGYTTSILDTLRAQGVIVSFGITGRWAEQNPDLLRRIVAEGHHLINHTYDHGSFTGLSTKSAPLSTEARHRQLDRTAEVVRAIAGAEFGPYFRPPYGDYDASVNADIAARGYTWNVMWTVDSLGWNGLRAAAITDRCLARATPGAIYIFHVGSQSQDALALPAIIDGLRRQGYALGSVAALLEG